MFRGFLLPQLYVKALARFRPGVALASALAGSQVLFALTHISHRIFILSWPMSDLAQDQLELVGYGFSYDAVYLVTGNTLISVGLFGMRAWWFC